MNNAASSWKLKSGEQVVTVALSESQWATVVAGLYVLENQQRRLFKEPNARRVHELRRSLHKTIGEQLVERRGGEENEFTYGFPGDEP